MFPRQDKINVRLIHLQDKQHGKTRKLQTGFKISKDDETWHEEVAYSKSDDKQTKEVIKTRKSSLKITPLQQHFASCDQ